MKNILSANKKRIFSRMLPLAIGLSLFGGVVLSAAVGPSDLSKNKESRNLTASAPAAAGRTLHIESTEADLTVIAGSETAVSVEAVVEVSDADKDIVQYFLDNTKIVLEPAADGLKLRLLSPMDEMEKINGRPPRTGIFARFFKGDKFVFKLSYAARLNIRIPSRQSLDVDNAYGHVQVKGVSGRLDIVNRSGKVKVEECGGELFLQNSYDLVEVPGFAGPVDIKNPNGKVVIGKIKGAARVENSYDAVDFGGIGGNLVVISKSGAVTGSVVEGDCEISSSYEKVDVRNVKGRLTVRAPNGEVSAADITKDAIIENSYNAVGAVRIGGGLRITGNSSAVTADDIGGDAFILTSYNPVTATRIKGSLEVDASSAKITIRTVTGNARVRTSYESVSAEDIGGALDVKSQSGAVKATGVKRDATIVTSYSMVEALRIGGKLIVENPSGAVTAEDVGGDANVKNSYNAVILRMTSGSIDVQGNSSPIEIDRIRSLPKGSSIRLLTSYANVRLTMPAGLPVAISVKSEDGNISSDLPVYQSDVESERFKADVAKGAIPVRIETSSGDIILKSGK